MKWIVWSFSALFLLGLVSCTKCYNCSKRIVIEVDNQPVVTDEFFQEEACGKDEKNELVGEGFSCSRKV